VSEWKLNTVASLQTEIEPEASRIWRIVRTTLRHVLSTSLTWEPYCVLV